MYHYVRYAQKALPHFTFLHRDDFLSQLKFLKREIGLVHKEKFLEWVGDPASIDEPKGVILTFDDGFADHYLNVAPILAEENAWGIFYIPTSVVSGDRILNVHKIHLILGHLGSNKCLSLLNQTTTASMFSDELRSKFESKTYTRQQSSTESTKLFKRALNYYSDYRWQTELLDRIVVESGISESLWSDLCSDLYMTAEMIQSLHKSGHIVGSHSVSHRLMSRLPTSEQRVEIDLSLATLRAIIKEPVRTFCYPYGGFHSFTRETESLLREAGVEFAFNVEHRDLATNDALTRPFALPRYDCNHFPWGMPTQAKNLDAR